MKAKTPVIGFLSPKSAGTTLVASNAAILWKKLHPDQKVLFIQLTSFPDIQVMLDIPVQKTIFDLVSFTQSRSDWTDEVLDQTITQHPLPILHSPEGMNTWEKIPHDFLKTLLNLVRESQDIIFLDLGVLPVAHLNSALESCDHLISVLHFDLVNLARQKTLMQDIRSDFPNLPWSVIFNQCPKEAKSLLSTWQKETSLPIIGMLPRDPETIWNNVFQKTPAAFQPESSFTQELQKVLPYLVP